MMWDPESEAMDLARRRRLQLQRLQEVVRRAGVRSEQIRSLEDLQGRQHSGMSRRPA